MEGQSGRCHLLDGNKGWSRRHHLSKSKGEVWWDARGLRQREDCDRAGQQAGQGTMSHSHPHRNLWHSVSCSGAGLCHIQETSPYASGPLAQLTREIQLVSALPVFPSPGNPEMATDSCSSRGEKLSLCEAGKGPCLLLSQFWSYRSSQGTVHVSTETACLLQTRPCLHWIPR